VFVTIKIRDLPPVHTLAGAASGNGSPANPYTATFIVGDDGSAGLDLAAVSDPNASQTVTLANLAPGPANPAGGAGFTVALSGGMLTATPANALQAADIGTHLFTATVTDGTNPVDIELALQVLPPGTLAITTSSPLPQGRPGEPYGATLAAVGATGAVTWALQSGALPTGLSLDTSTGEISGTPAQEEQRTFTIRASDTAGSTATKSLEITIRNPSEGPSGDAGCSTSRSGGIPWFGVLLMGALTMLLRRSLLAPQGLGHGGKRVARYHCRHG
jgi:hypothetical protein